MQTIDRLLLLPRKSEIYRVCPTITPDAGAELLTDGAVEDWASATNLTSWSEALAGTSTVNRESTIVQADTYSCRLDIDGSNSNAQILQQVTAAAGSILRQTFWGYSSASGKTMKELFNDGGGRGGPQRNPGTTWTQYTQVWLAINANPSIGFNRHTAASASLYGDAFSAKVLPLLSCAAYLGRRAIRPGTYQCAPTVDLGTQAGLLISYSNPQNCVLCIVDGAGANSYSATLYKIIGGTWTSVISAAITYSAGAALKVIIAANGTDYSLYYNGSQVGSTTAITDAGLGTMVLGFSSYASNTVGLSSTSKAVA